MSESETTTHTGTLNIYNWLPLEKGEIKYTLLLIVSFHFATPIHIEGLKNFTEKEFVKELKKQEYVAVYGQLTTKGVLDLCKFYKEEEAFASTLYKLPHTKIFTGKQLLSLLP